LLIPSIASACAAYWNRDAYASSMSNPPPLESPDADPGNPRGDITIAQLKRPNIFHLTPCRHATDHDALTTKLIEN